MDKCESLGKCKEHKTKSDCHIPESKGILTHFSDHLVWRLEQGGGWRNSLGLRMCAAHVLDLIQTQTGISKARPGHTCTLNLPFTLVVE